MAGLERVIYQSTGTGRTDSLLNMATILAESQRNNDRDGMTGALAAHDGKFIQVLEGKASDLDRLISRLGRDPRHKGILIIERYPADSRLFDGWSMANARINPTQGARLDDLMARRNPVGSEILSIMQDAVRET